MLHNAGDRVLVGNTSGVLFDAVFVRYADAETRRYVWLSLEAGIEDPFPASCLVSK